MRLVSRIICFLLFAAPAFAQQVNTDIIPASPGLQVGHSNQRWNGWYNHLHCFDINGVLCPPEFTPGTILPINPGTPWQVIRYDPTGTNIQDSTGNDNPAHGPTEWTSGLSVTANGLAKSGVNSPAGTTTNLLVCRDTSVTAILQVTTCGVSANGVGGVADNGAGSTGTVQIYDHGYHTCVFDNQTVIGDWVIPSTTVGGQCSDAGGTKPSGPQVLGHVTSLNTGAGTLSSVDWFTGDTVAPGGGGTSVTVLPCSITGCFAYYNPANVVNGDPNTNLDGSGHGQLRSLGLTNPNFSGFWYETAGPTPITDATVAAPANSTLFYVDSTITTPNSFKMPKAAGAADVGKAWGVSSSTTDVNGNPVDIMGIITAGGTTEFQTNGVDNANCTAGACPLQNLVASTGITLTNTSGGNVSIAAAVAANPQALNPTAPAAVVNGTPASTDYKYLVQGCEDGPTCAFHSAPTSVTDVPTGAAAITSVNSITLKTYADTLYGYRCYNIYRTASSGTPATVGKIATCVWKSFIDTGLAGDTTTAPAGNTTVLDANGNTAPLPGCNKHPAAPYGIDGPPCVPNIIDDEFTWGSGSFSPGDANNPSLTRVNFGTSTATLTQGALVLAPQTTTGIRMLSVATPGASTPYSYVIAFNMNATLPAGPNGLCGLGLYDGTKLETFELHHRAAGPFWVLDIIQWTGVNTFSATAATSPTNGADVVGGWIYFKVQNDGTNINWLYSYDGINYGGAPFYTEAKAAFLANTNNVGIFCQSDAGTTETATFDYFRRTQ